MKIATLFLALACVAIFPGTPQAGPADGILHLDGPLGAKSKLVGDLMALDEQDITLLAVVFALSPEGWDLEARGGVLHYRGPTAWNGGGSSWTGGTEWAISRLPASETEDFGYQSNGNMRELEFHTDDTVSRGFHDVCEPLPFGVISGLYGGDWANCAVEYWGSFWVEGPATSAVGMESTPQPLVSAYPNPSRGAVFISVEGSQRLNKVLILDPAGQIVAIVWEKAGGSSTDLRWDGTDSDGHLVPAGIYFVVVIGDTWRQSKRVVVLR